MIHIATIHWKSPKWIDLQRQMLQRYISVPYKVYAYLTEIDSKYNAAFDHILNVGDPTHAEKLNSLSKLILSSTQDDDWIMFIDGDAFPVSPLAEQIDAYMRNAPLIAIQRLDNMGEKHAHPAFCITTVKFWKQIQGDWNKGYQWINALDYAETDVGGSLLYALTKHNVSWMPLHRTNKKDLVPVCFGIYGDLIYHHGAGFRTGVPRGVMHQGGVFRIYRRWDARILNNIIPKRFVKKIRDSWLHPEGRLKQRLVSRVQRIEKEVTKQLFTDAQVFLASLRTGQIDPGFERLMTL